MNITKISVVIPTYNRQSLLNRAVTSVLSQKFPSLVLDLVVVDDCSGEAADLSSFDDERVQLIRLNENSGPQVARNTGILHAKGDWVIMLDDDDELTLGALEKAVNHIRTVENYRSYPVFFFATTRGFIPQSYMTVTAADLMNSILTGDFTPVLQRQLFQQYDLRYFDYPEIHGVGCEQLTWLFISSKFGIPAFITVLVKVNLDARMRLTSYDNFIINSYKFALQQDITIEFVRRHQLQQLGPEFVEKKKLGAAIYYLVSGNKQICRDRLRSLSNPATGVSRMMELLSYLPVFIPRFLFLRYKRVFSK